MDSTSLEGDCEPAAATGYRQDLQEMVGRYGRHEMHGRRGRRCREQQRPRCEVYNYSIF